jgi:hypothetical protein
MLCPLIFLPALYNQSKTSAHKLQGKSNTDAEPILNRNARDWDSIVDHRRITEAVSVIVFPAVTCGG